jgi:superfamily II DNA/RNA helicase
MLAPKSSLKMVYGSSQVQRAFIRLAQGPFVGIWDRASLAKLAGLSVETWASQTTKERRRSFNHGVKRALAELSSNLASLAYSDHPFEQYIIEQLREEAPDLQTLVFVRDRLPAHFLADRLSYLLSSCRLKAVPLTGSGEQMRHGLSRTERASNLQALAEGRVQIVVTTSAGNEGIDFKQVQRGFACRFSGSPTVALQQWGRVGRHDLRGRVEYLCSTPEAYWKFLSILRKVTAFYRMLNRERQAILDQESSR